MNIKISVRKLEVGTQKGWWLTRPRHTIAMATLSYVANENAFDRDKIES